MDQNSFAAGVLMGIGMCGAVIGIVLAATWSARRDPLRCSDCGSRMIETGHPDSTLARRYTECQVCGRRDSYVDQARVKAARQ